MKHKTEQELRTHIQDSDDQWFTFGVTDIDGIFRAKTVHKDKFLKSLEEGVGFCNVIFGWDANDACYENTSLVGWDTGFPDVTASIDPKTGRRIPWDDDRPLFIADLRNSELSSLCPRSLLSRITDKAREMGFEAKGSSEFEWGNFSETPHSIRDKSYVDPVPLSPGMFGYSMLRMGQNREYVQALRNQLLAFGIPIEGIHTETGDGVYEAAIAYSELNEAADRAALFKTAVKIIAHQFDILPTFMAKWNTALPGNSQHLHMSLWKDGQNMFAGPSTDNESSDLMKQFLAGVLYCLPHVQPLYAPLTNSYKRYVKGSWAPTTVSWGKENRTTAVRVIPGSSSSARLENRMPGADANPYLAMAATLASGIYGITNKLEPGDATTGNAYVRGDLQPISFSLKKATQAMKESDLARELFGDEFVRHFVETREWEIQQQTNDPQWEQKRYFEVI